jgi:hypothetical protein
MSSAGCMTDIASTRAHRLDRAARELATTASNSRLHSPLRTRVAGQVSGGAALGVSAFVHAPWWVYLSGVLLALVPATLPQESEHRRDFYRDYFRHREQMVRIRQRSHRLVGRSTRGDSHKPEPSREGIPLTARKLRSTPTGAAAGIPPAQEDRHADTSQACAAFPHPQPPPSKLAMPTPPTGASPPITRPQDATAPRP